MRAIICGHTGATGKVVLDELVKSKWVEEIVTIGRREYEEYRNHPKVKQIIVSDLRDLSKVGLDEVGKIEVAFDLVASSYATSFKGEEIYRMVDVDMTSEFAKLAHKSGATFLSSIGMATADTGKDYASRAKRDFENYARKLGFKRLAFMHPKFVNREKDSKWYEYFVTLGGLKAVKASEMGRCIVWAAKHQTEAERVYSEKEMKEIAKQVI